MPFLPDRHRARGAPRRRVAAADGPVRVRFILDLDTAGIGAFVSVPMSLRTLIASLPPEAQPVLGWIPDIVLDGVGLRFDTNPTTRSFGVYAAAGVTGSAAGSADAFIVTLPDPADGVVLIAGLRLSSTVDLAGTPLFGSMLSGLALSDLQVSYASADVKAGRVVLPPPAPRTSPAFTKGLQLSFTVVAGDAKEQFVLTPSSFRAPGSVAAVHADGQDLAAWDQAGPPPIQWFAVQKSFGPLTLGRVGVLTTAERFGLALDASVATKALSIDLAGFTVSFRADDISPAGVRVDLDGLGVAFTSGSVSLSGSLVRTETDDMVSYDGSLLLQVGRFGVTAVGSYAILSGYASLFVFGLVKGAFGGPPAFFVTGLAAGFGYNRGLRLPEPDQVQSFPLVIAARQGSSYLPDPTVAAALGKLASGGWVPPELGSYWVAVGVKFSSFQLIDSFVLLLVQFGNELVIAVVGISSLQLPKAGWGRPYAYVELVLIAVIRPAAGTVQVTALLTPNSFVIDKACRLSGGFAFYLWFGEQHRGDFVLTIGGYHDFFDKPDHYPVVPRLGISWAMSQTLRLEGSAYFALTPSCVMAGGRLDLAFRSGELRAWFRAHADFLMYWRPFFFHIGIGISVGASYTLHIGAVHKTFSVELGAQVELWGPPLAGVAHVTWWIISFTIDINGGGRPDLPGRVIKDWPTFAASFLPAREEVCKPRADAGLTGVVKDGDVTVWLVAPPDLVLSSETAIPATVLVAGAPGTKQVRFDGSEVGVYPMGSLTMVTCHLLELYHSDGRPVDVSGWAWAPQESGLPESLWGTVNNGQPDLSSELVPGLTGLRGAPPVPARTGPPPMPVEVLGHDELDDGDLPLPAGSIDGSTGPPGADARLVIAETVAQPQVRATRAGIVAELGRLGLGRGLVPGDLSLLATQVRRTFPAPPLLGPPGTTGPRQDTPAHSAGEPAPRAPSRPEPTAQASLTKPQPILAAVFRRHQGRIAALVFDSFSSGPERAALAGLSGEAGAGQAARLRPGTSLVWDLPPGAARHVETNGLPVAVDAFDPQFRLIGQATVDADAHYQLPARTARLLVTCPAPAPAAAAVSGWSADSVLLQVGPQALVGNGVIIRPQAPVRVRRRRGSRPVGRIDGAALVDQNWTEPGTGRERGWIITTVPPWARSVNVTMARDDGKPSPPGSPAGRAADAWLLRSGDRIPLRSSRVRAGAVAATVLRYALPRASGEAVDLPILVAPRPGWYQQGLSADPGADPAARSASAPESASADAAEVCIR